MIFLSYSQKDFKKVAEIYVELFKQINEEVWFGPEIISFGQSWEDKVNEAIKNSRVILLLLDVQQIELGFGENFNREFKMIQNSLSIDSNKKFVIAQIGKAEEFENRKVNFLNIQFLENFIQTPIINFSNFYYGNDNIKLSDSSEFKELLNVLNLFNNK